MKTLSLMSFPVKKQICFLFLFPQNNTLDLAMLISKLVEEQDCWKASNNLRRPIYDCDINNASSV